MSKKIIKISSIVSGISGVVILFSVLYPILSYQPKGENAQPSLISPVDVGARIEDLDYTRASNWFSGLEADFTPSKVSYYTLSIPKLKIEKAAVAIGGEDLSESLIQYPGTANPGRPGNSVIFGHSILPQFYDPKDYLAIFSTLPTLSVGDEILVNYDGVSFRYRVETMFEVLPTDLQVLEQDQSDSFLTLVTCTPPGHPLKPRRLIVRARVVPLENL